MFKDFLEEMFDIEFIKGQMLKVFIEAAFRIAIVIALLICIGILQIGKNNDGEIFVAFNYVAESQIRHFAIIFC